MSSGRPSTLQVKPIGYRSPSIGLSVVGVKRKRSVPDSKTSVLKDCGELLNKSSEIKPEENKLPDQQRSKTKISNLQPVVCLKHVDTVLTVSKMRKASLSPKVPSVATRQSPDLRCRSQSPRKRSNNDSPKTRSPRKKKSESPDKLHGHVSLDIPENKAYSSSAQRSPKSVSPRPYGDYSPQKKETSALEKKELSPRELDAIKTLRKLKARSPQKKAITNEMRKSACHSKQNERRDSVGAPSLQKSPESKNKVPVPTISVTDPKGVKVKESTKKESPKKGRKKKTNTVSEQETSVVIKTEVKASPKKRGRKKKSSTSSPDKSDQFLDDDSFYDIPASLTVESTSSIRRRVRSPSAKYKQDMIMYPWDSPKKRQSPKKSPTNKLPTAGTSKEDDSSGSEESSSDETTDTNAENESPSAAKVPSRDSILCAARVLNFDEVNANEYSKIGERLYDTNKYRSLLHAAQDKVKTEPIGLSDLISKVSGAVDKPNEELLNLFGSIEEPDYCDDNVTYLSDEDEETVIKNQENSDEKLVEKESDSAENTEKSNESSIKGIQDTGQSSGNDTSEENVSKQKNDSDLDSTIEYGKDISPKAADKVIKSKDCIGISQDIQNNPVSSDLTGKAGDMCSAVLISNDDLSESKKGDQHSDYLKERNVFDLFSDNDEKMDNSNSETPPPAVDSFSDNEVIEHVSEDSIPDILDSYDNMSSESSAPLRVNDVSNQVLEDKVDSIGQKVTEISENMFIDLENKTENAGTNDTQKTKDCKSENVSKDKIANDKDNDILIVSQTIRPKSSDVIVLSDNETDDKNNNSNTLKTDRRGFEQLRSSPRSVPRFSTVRKNFSEPSSLAVLKSVEKETTDKSLAFMCPELDDYLKPYVPDVEMNENSKIALEKKPLSQTENEKDTDLGKAINAEASSELDAADKCVADVVAKLHSPRPDLDEVDDCMFLSFASEEALLAHVELEKKLDWLDESNLKRMMNMMNRDKVCDHDTPTPSKSPHTKHNMRGVPGRVTKYRKMLKQEYDIILKAKENRVPSPLRTKTPEKTTDITKIKGWKKKFANTAELQEATGLHFSEAGKLHWRTEERIMKQMEPDEVKEIGLDLKKKRRKLVHFTKRKGESKTDKTKHSEAFDESEEPLPLGPPDNLDTIEDESPKEPQEKIPYSVRYHSQHKYGKRKMFVKQMKMNAEDENILKKLGSQKIAADCQKKKRSADAESKPRKSKAITYVVKLSHSMALEAVSALNKKLIIKAKAIARQKEKKKELKAKSEKAKQADEVDNDTVHEIRDNLESSSGSDGEGSDGYEEIPENEINNEIQDEEKGEILEKGDNGSRPRKSDHQEKDDSEKSKACDQPGCRYGCICHLYKFSAEKDSEKEDSDHKPPCDKEYCRLGCICDSIDTKTEDQSHCGKPDCMFGCKCRPKNRNQKSAGERTSRETGETSKEEGETTKDRRKSKGKDSGQQKGKKRSRRRKPQSRKNSLDDEDIAELNNEIEESKGDKSDWEPPAKKQRESTKTPAGSGPRYADLPKRETRYRLAKNLDAVTRKAKQVYESSEMYMEQRVRRRRSDPVIEMVNDGDFLDHLPPDWRDSFDMEPSTSTSRSASRTQAREEKGDTMQPSTSLSGPELSEEEDEDWVPPQGTLSCARTAGYSGHRKCNKPHVIEDSPEKQSDSHNQGSSKQKETVLIDLVDSDCEVTEVRQEKTKPHPRAEDRPRELTASEKLGMNKRRLSQDSKKPSSETKWKTQMVCLKAKKKAQSDSEPSNAESEIKLLEIISNCNWEVDRANMLSKISHIISKDYSQSNVVLWNNYALQFLPKANKPAVIPPELKAKLPNSMYSIRIRVTQNLHDIEQAENASGKDSDATASERLLAEKVNSLSDKDKEQYASLTGQKKLIDKIRFAEKLKELIEQEEKKGTYSSKFSISKDGIEKALKRYKTQLWRAYTGNSNMTLEQLREAVMKAKSSNYTEKINQAITAIEQKAQDSTNETPQSDATDVSATTSAEGNTQGLGPVTTVADTSVSGPVTETTKSVTDSAIVKPGSDLRTLSSSAKARIEANQGIVIKGNAHSIASSKAPMTRLITQGGKQSDIYLVPVTGESATSPAAMPGKLNLMSSDGTTSVVSLQPVPGSTTAFKITESEAAAGLAALKTLTTSTSAPIAVSTAVPVSTAPLTSPLTLTTLAAPVTSSLGTPRMLKPVLASSVGKPVRMQMLVNGHPENIRGASPGGPPGPTPMILSGTINGQKVLAIQKVNPSQPSQAVSTTLHSSVNTSILNTLAQSSANLVTLTANVADTGQTLKKVVSQTSQGITQSSSVGVNRPHQPVTMVTGPQTGPMSNPHYPPVRLVAANPQQIGGKLLTAANQSNQFVPVSQPYIRSQQPVPNLPPNLVQAGPRQMLPIRLINPANNSNTIVQLIPVTSAPTMNSDSGILKSIPGTKPEFIAVPVQPVHFDKSHVASQSSSYVPQTLVNGVDNASSGMKTLHRSSSPAAAFINTPHGVLQAVPITNPRAISPGTNLVPVSLGKHIESDIKMITIPHTENYPTTKAGTSKVKNYDKNETTESAVPEIEYIGSYKLQKDSTALNEFDKKVEKSDERDLNDVETLQSNVFGKTEIRIQRRKRKSYTAKLVNLNKLEPACLGAVSGDENIEQCRDSQESTDSVSLANDAKYVSLSTDIINLHKPTEDTTDFSDELKSDLNTKSGKLQKSVEIDSLDGDSNFKNSVESSPSVLSESSDTCSVNISAVIDNTKNAGLQLASALGNTLDSPVINRTAKEVRPSDDISVTKKPEVIDLEENESVLEGPSIVSKEKPKALALEEPEAVLEEVSEIDNDSQDSDGCLIIDENYVSPTKKTFSSQDIELPEGGSSKKRKLEDIVEENSGNKRCRDTDSGSPGDTTQNADSTQICIEDSGDEGEVESINSNLGAPGPEEVAMEKKRKRKRSPLTKDKVMFIPIMPVQPQVAGTVSPTEYLVKPDSFLQNFPDTLQKHRRREMKKKFTTLAKLVLMFNPDMKEKYINFITDSTVQLPKMKILDGAKDLIEHLQEEYQCLNELLTDGKQYNEALKNKLKKLTDSFMKQGHSEIVVSNFLKGVASSVKMRMKNPDGEWDVKPKPKKKKNNQSNATAVPASQSSSSVVHTSQSSATKVTSSQSNATIIPTSKSSVRKNPTNQSSATIVPMSQPNFSDIHINLSKDPMSQLKKIAKVVKTVSVDLTEDSVVDAECINNVKQLKILNDNGTQKLTGSKLVPSSEPCDGSSSVISAENKTTDSVGNLIGNSKNGSTITQASDILPQTTVVHSMEQSQLSSTTASNNGSNLPLGKSVVLKPCDNQENCDSQSSADKIETNQSCATVIQTNQSNETSSQTSSQSSEKIVLMDSSILETSAAKINHSELTILDDLEAEEQGQVHHLDDILDEWSATICS